MNTRKWENFREPPVKPPLGVVPREIWIERRREELKRAISAYLEADILGPLAGWIKELTELK